MVNVDGTTPFLWEKEMTKLKWGNGAFYFHPTAM